MLVGNTRVMIHAAAVDGPVQLATTQRVLGVLRSMIKIEIERELAAEGHRTLPGPCPLCADS